MSGSIESKSAEIEASYKKLKASKEAERELIRFKPLILAAPADGIADRELIAIIKKAYPSIKLTVKKLAALRAIWAKEEESQAAIGQVQEVQADAED